MKSVLNISILVCILVSFSSCNFLFGSKQDDTVSDVLKQGAIDPNLVPKSVAYVPVLPIWQNFSNPVDVFVGYDEMVYVLDDKGINILDLKGTVHRVIPITKANKITQDRRLNLWVTARQNVVFNGTTFSLPVVYMISGASTLNGAVFMDTLVHPFMDPSRVVQNRVDANDELVEFTGITVLADNSIYLARRGPTNNPSSTILPDNIIFVLDKDGNYKSFTNGLNSYSPGLKSILDVSAISSFVAPPQSLYGISASADFLVLQTRSFAEYKALWIKRIENPDVGTEYVENTDLLDFDTTKASGFLYQSNKFTKPTDICFAPDETRYIFIVDQAKDSIFQFTSKGYEGVNAPANTELKRQISVSFGGRGSGPFQFNQPTGIAYFRRVLYVADKGNNRIMRYKLSTDLER